jgi:Mn2+/Fe2+ NRAMP family transporter
MIYGFGSLAAIIIVNILKRAFFEYGTRYGAATGESLIDGYRKLGNWAVISYFFVMIISLFFVSAAVFQVSAVFMKELFQLQQLEYTFLALVVVIGSCFIILAIGKYRFLDGFIKVVGIVMIICALISFVLVIYKGAAIRSDQFIAPDLLSLSTIPFAIALMGWMPTALVLSTWNSL